MDFNATTIVRYPIEVVWQAMRDKLPEIARNIDDIESITVDKRRKLPDGKLEVINIWKASPKLPSIILNQLKPEMMIWTDSAIWDENCRSCNWTIDPHYFSKKIVCQGSTTFEEALGGNGTRLTLRGNIYINASKGLSGTADGVIGKVIESVLTKILPSNFAKLAKAIAIHIEK